MVMNTGIYAAFYLQERKMILMSFCFIFIEVCVSQKIVT